MKEYLYKLIFPENCVFCGRPTKLHSAEPRRCEKCAENMPYLNNLSGLDHEEPGIIRGVSVFRYDAVKASVFRFKYDGYRSDGEALAEYMARYVIDNALMDILEADILVPVPLWKRKEEKRGFNQSAVIAGTASRLMNVPHIDGLLVRTRETAAQKGLDRDRRRENLRGAFQFNENYDINGMSVVLIDDIYTTGSTIYECAKTLYAAGAGEVLYIALSSPGAQMDEIEYDDKSLIGAFDKRDKI